jgi:tRNA pseudouridine13 synthase
VGLSGWRHLTADEPPIAFVARAKPEDFRVTELLDAETGGEGGDGTHVHFEVEKRGIDTFAAVRRLARALGRSPREFGRAGLKDADAVTRQTLSIEGIEPALLEGLELPDLRVLATRRRDRKLRPGQLRGNRFELRLRGLASEDLPRAERVLAVLAERGLPNAFGPQRFGARGDNAELGALLATDGAAAYLEALLLREGRRAPALRRAARRLERDPADPRAALGVVDRALVKLHVGALQAALFNRVLFRRVDGIDRVERGDLAWLHDRGACFLVEDVSAEAPRAARLEISPTGPLAGVRTDLPEGEPGALERADWGALGLDPLAPAFGDAPAPRGARRPLRVPLGELRVARGGPGELELSFSLPRGSYASAVLEELGKGAADPGTTEPGGLS